MRRSCLVRMVRRMLLVVVVLEIGFDERPFVRLRIGIGVYGVRGIRDASTCQLYYSIGSERGDRRERERSDRGDRERSDRDSRGERESSRKHEYVPTLLF